MLIARFARLTLSAFAVAAVLATPAASEEFKPYFSFSGKKRLPDCTASSVTGAVTGTVSRAQKSYNDGIRIVGIDNIQEVAYQANGVSPIARRYCNGKASLSDGSLQQVHYMLEENAGFAGVSWRVEACLSPLDKWHVYGGDCSTTRPH